MPLARILTLHPEHAGTLAHQLETHGYKVEFGYPEADASANADLLVSFDLSPNHAALARAVQLAEELHCDIAVERGFETAAPQPDAAHHAIMSDESQEQSVSSAPEEHFSPDHFSYNQEVPVVDSQPMIPAQLGAKTSGRFVNTLAQGAAKALISARTVAGDALDSARHFGQEYRQKLDLSRAERSAVRQQRLLELEHQKVLAQERAKELDAAWQSAAQRLQELLRERGEAADSAQANPPAPVSPSVPPPQSRAIASAGFLRAQLIRLMGHRYTPQTEAIITGVAAVTALFAVGLVLASFHPRAALSNSLDHPPAKGSGITVQTGGVTLKPAPVQPPAAVRPAAAPIPASPKASPVHRAQAGSETSFGSDVTVRNLRTKQTAGSRNATVRKVRPQARPAAVKLQPQDGIKHISDLDN